MKCLKADTFKSYGRKWIHKFHKIKLYFDAKLLSRKIICHTQKGTNEILLKIYPNGYGTGFGFVLISHCEK